MRKLQWFVIFFAVATLAACTSMTPDEQLRAISVAQKLFDAGIITQQELDAYKKSISGAGSADIWGMVITGVISAVGAWFGVPIITNLQRGNINNRKGEMPKSDVARVDSLARSVASVASDQAIDGMKGPWQPPTSSPA